MVLLESVYWYEVGLASLCGEQSLSQHWPFLLTNPYRSIGVRSLVKSHQLGD